jgi:hypothetical protein
MTSTFNVQPFFMETQNTLMTLKNMQFPLFVSILDTHQNMHLNN